MYTKGSTRTRRITLACAAALAAAITSQANAERIIEREHVHFDGRFEHDQFYHDRGYVVTGVPRGAYTLNYAGSAFFYRGGEWYRPVQRVSVVVAAPIGAYVPVLPPVYSTVWWRGVPYYYANDTYYAWMPDASQYEVVMPPAGIERGGSTQAPAEDSVFAYPKDGQSTEQQSKDRYECHHYAVEATGYDPTKPDGGVAVAMVERKRADYVRAQSACLDARGYSVK